MTGVIKRLVRDKGFGFIATDGGGAGAEFFFHRSAVERPDHFEELVEGQQVQFEEERGEKGPRAGSVRRV